MLKWCVGGAHTALGVYLALQWAHRGTYCPDRVSPRDTVFCSSSGTGESTFHSSRDKSRLLAEARKLRTTREASVSPVPKSRCPALRTSTKGERLGSRATVGAAFASPVTFGARPPGDDFMVTPHPARTPLGSSRQDIAWYTCVHRYPCRPARWDLDFVGPWRGTSSSAARTAGLSRLDTGRTRINAVSPISSRTDAIRPRTVDT